MKPANTCKHRCSQTPSLLSEDDRGSGSALNTNAETGQQLGHIQLPTGQSYCRLLLDMRGFH